MSNIPSVEKTHVLADQIGRSLFDPAPRPDPYPVFRQLREYVPIYHGPAGVWILSGYSDITAVLRDPQFGYKEPCAVRTRALLVQEDPAGPLTDENGRSVSSFLTQNPPEHTRLREFVSPAFTIQAVERLTRRITEHTDALLNAAIGAGDIDLVELFASPFPSA